MLARQDVEQMHAYVNQPPTGSEMPLSAAEEELRTYRCLEPDTMLGTVDQMSAHTVPSTLGSMTSDVEELGDNISALSVSDESASTDPRNPRHGKQGAAKKKKDAAAAEGADDPSVLVTEPHDYSKKHGPQPAQVLHAGQSTVFDGIVSKVIKEHISVLATDTDCALKSIDSEQLVWKKMTSDSFFDDYYYSVLGYTLFTKLCIASQEAALAGKDASFFNVFGDLVERKHIDALREHVLADLAFLRKKYEAYVCPSELRDDSRVVNGLVGRCRMSNAEDWPTRM